MDHADKSRLVGIVADNANLGLNLIGLEQHRGTTNGKLALKEWKDTERLVIGGGFSTSRIGRSSLTRGFSAKYSARGRFRKNSEAFQRRWPCGRLRSEPVLLNRLL
jgi:hypothetical protein